jgi:transcription antitermination factor NusG
MYEGRDRNHICWYAIHTHHQQDKRVENNLKAWQVETFAPKIRERRSNQFSGAPIYYVKPLFSRYVFARFNARKLLHKIYFTRGVHSIVSVGSDPIPIDDEDIALLQSRVAEDGFVRLGRDLKQGDKVKITGGTFGNLSGVFERDLKDSERVMILLTAISYQGRLVVDRDLLAKIG